MYRGSCLCGGVTYQINGELGALGFCHCQRCQKANGTAFNAAALVKVADLDVVTGRELMTDYESSPGVFRVFCRVCGAPLFSRRTAMPEAVRLRVGTLDTPWPTRPTAHIFVASKAPWFDILDDAPQFAERPPAPTGKP
ncbi:MAG TPA: GFA family protein [Polyangia bacterium]|jgi:hypothetical protein